MTNLNLTYDKAANAGYLYIAKSYKLPVETTPIHKWILMDFDEDGTIVGLEFLFCLR